MNYSKETQLSGETQHMHKIVVKIRSMVQQHNTEQKTAVALFHELHCNCKPIYRQTKWYCIRKRGGCGVCVWLTGTENKQQFDISLIALCTVVCNIMIFL